jgi:hypothetical protein
MDQEFQEALDKFMAWAADAPSEDLATEPVELKNMRLALTRQAIQALSVTMYERNAAGMEAIKVVLRMSKLIDSNVPGTTKSVKG